MPADITARTPRLAVLALPLLALLAPPAAAGPPQGVSGRMAFDHMADGLRRYATTKEHDERMALLERLAESRDPRVAVALARVVSDPGDGYMSTAGCLLLWNYGRRVPVLGKAREDAQAWWDKHEADLRRRAGQLSR